MQKQELHDLNELALYKKRELYYLVNAYQTENWEFVVLPTTCLTTTEANQGTVKRVNASFPSPPFRLFLFFNLVIERFMPHFDVCAIFTNVKGFLKFKT